MEAVSKSTPTWCEPKNGARPLYFAVRICCGSLGTGILTVSGNSGAYLSHRQSRVSRVVENKPLLLCLMQEQQERGWPTYLDKVDICAPVLDLRSLIFNGKHVSHSQE